MAKETELNPNSSESKSEFEQRVIVELSKIKTRDDLKKLVGEFTPEEQKLLDSVHFEGSLPEEIAQKDAGFTKKIIIKAAAKSYGLDTPPSEDSSGK